MNRINKKTKNQKTIVIDLDVENGNDIHGVGEYSFVFTEE